MLGELGGHLVLGELGGHLVLGELGSWGDCGWSFTTE